MAEPCEPCAEYRRGERENIEAFGVTVHVCERKREGWWDFDPCPCGCPARPSVEGDN